MERVISGFHQDPQGDWVAELDCGHDQHVRHRPPFQVRPWVLSPAGREARIGTRIGCPLCDRAELPASLRPVRSSPEWDEHTVPPGLRRAHRLPAGTWGRITVHEGELGLTRAGDPPCRVELRSGSPGEPIPPEVEHAVEVTGPVRFSLEFLAVDRRSQETTDGDAPDENVANSHDEGGDPACWAASVCPECDALTSEGPHRPGCPASES